ncbi:MarR family transcriptional regulator [Actinoplanes sp. ATCC 53533]|uniref:MarR family winged helix-turn-helix transcriptional regulator n=1 Tax=Actinoplanes sp. ATCC 53533 TaxID=1288362 RepID=UPI000F77B6E3|nr:MarR family transcriptional regulator [Actinoplanes sp. ATCC 53533]RSM63941.1 MarR family transcriptional regulator [Actinoplanes sp. ATCC 53533]
MTQENTEPVGTGAMNRVIWALRQAEQTLQTLKEQRLRPLGMAPAHYSLLISIHTHPGITGAELARRLTVTPQSVASLVARLADKGQLERRSHPRHRHVQELHLTDAGRQALHASDAVIAAIEHRITTRLGPDDTARFTATLGEVVDAVRDTQP